MCGAYFIYVYLYKYSGLLMYWDNVYGLDEAFFFFWRCGGNAWRDSNGLTKDAGAHGQTYPFQGKVRVR
jgi:hypothetical protein